MNALMNMNRLLLIAFLLPLLSGCRPGTPARGGEEMYTDPESIALRMQSVLDSELGRWYPLCIDSAGGGFFSDIDYRWALDGRQDKMIVTQARHVWSAAHAAMYKRKYRPLLAAAAHGFEFLRGRMWDRVYGGFYDLVTRNGDPVGQNGMIVKTAYGNAFAIYALAAYYKASGDTTALDLARRAFRWLEGHSYDPLFGGYYQFISREGNPFQEGFRGTPPKDQNSMIHLLESCTELYDVWPDSTLRERLWSLLHLVRDRITTEKGFMNLFFQRDWRPVSYRDSSAESRAAHYDIDHISFGHDVETAYLMMEASAALGLRDDSTTLVIAKRKVDFALRNGWDNTRGGLYDGGSLSPGDDRVAIARDTKEWWAQAEALNTFLIMSSLYPDDTLHYIEKFGKQWTFCEKYLIDKENGGWYWDALDTKPDSRYSPKGSIWKADYHTSRSMINCIRRLNTLAWRGNPFEPVNRNSTPEARKLLGYLYTIAGKKIVSGHQNYVGRFDTYPDRVQQITGKRPEIWGCDFINYGRKGNAEAVVREAYRKYMQGYIITLMWHAGRPPDDPPFGWKESIQAKLTDSEWEELITPGTSLNKRWTTQVDTVASYLGLLHQLGVPVLWRPYHESNGVWFWWGNRKGDRGSAKLYRMMFDRFVNVHRLDNLIWVWDANAPRRLTADEAFAYEDYFPGVECVDILAADVYHNDYRQSHHDELLELGGGKVIALGEVGEVPGPAVLSLQPLWTWFMIWGDFVDTHNTPAHIRNLYECGRTLTHEDFAHSR